MNIDIVVNKKTLHFHQAFKIAYEEVDQAEIVFLKIKDDLGNIGLGCASPDEEVTGETVSRVFKILKKTVTKNFFKKPIEDWYAYHELIQEKLKGYPSAQAATEEAILNLWSKRQKMPLSIFFGGYRKNCKAMITIGLKNESETLMEVKQRVREGFGIIKIKCGLNVKTDIKRIKAVRKILPKAIKLVLDANQGYSFTEAKKLLLETKDLGIEFIEQPLDSKDLVGMKKLNGLGLIPVIADESVVSFRDAVDIITNDRAAGVNIKLMKCGGPINFIKIFYLAKAYKKIVMIGCMYESSISITTGACLALGLPIDYVDLDSGHLDFYDDPTRGGAAFLKGKIFLSGKLRLKK